MKSNVQLLTTYGCSLTKDNYQSVWPDILAEEYNLTLTNYAERGAGYVFISDVIVKNINKIKNSICVVMWPSCDRLDLWANNETPQLQNDIKYASWLDGKEPLFCDLEGKYNNNNGYYLSGAVPRGLKHLYYKYFYTQRYHVDQAWKTIVLTQHFLDSHNVKYIMCSSYPLNNLVQYHDNGTTDFESEFLSQVNLTKFVDNSINEGFIQYCQRNEVEFFNAHYPKSTAHKLYTNEVLIPKLKSLLN